VYRYTLPPQLPELLAAQAGSNFVLALWPYACHGNNCLNGTRHGMEACMGDKSPKSKQRDQRQKETGKAGKAAAAKSKQDRYGQSPPPAAKGKK